MKLTHLTDEELDQQLVGLARKEREILTDILNHLRECEARRLYSKYKFQSLFEYAIKRMGYSEDQAARRISAMRLLKELPTIEEKIEAGSLTLTHLVKAQTLFNQEKKAERTRTNSEKLDLLCKIESTSKREAERRLAEESFVASLPQQPKIELDSFDASLQKKLTHLLGVRASARPNMTLHDLIDEMADLAIEKWDPLAKAERAARRKAVAEQKTVAAHVNEAACMKTCERLDESAPFTVTAPPIGASKDLKSDAPRPAPVRVESGSTTVRRGYSRYIPAALRHQVYMRDRGICRNCGSSHDVEVDHVVPLASGGASATENLRLLCRSCNQRHAIESFGGGVMWNYLKEPMHSYRGLQSGT